MLAGSSIYRSYGHRTDYVHDDRNVTYEYVSHDKGGGKTARAINIDSQLREDTLIMIVPFTTMVRLSNESINKVLSYEVINGFLELGGSISLQNGWIPYYRTTDLDVQSFLGCILRVLQGGVDRSKNYRLDMRLVNSDRKFVKGVLEGSYADVRSEVNYMIEQYRGSHATERKYREVADVVISRRVW